jgi:hypothetical protein
VIKIDIFKPEIGAQPHDVALIADDIVETIPRRAKRTKNRPTRTPRGFECRAGFGLLLCTI